jgi:hypothetical protein
MSIQQSAKSVAARQGVSLAKAKAMLEAGKQKASPQMKPRNQKRVDTAHRGRQGQRGAMSANAAGC